jgi:hypothetical protein
LLGWSKKQGMMVITTDCWGSDSCVDILFPRNWRHCSNRSHWHSFEVATSSGFRKQL